jgi:hypothetical protein
MGMTSEQMARAIGLSERPGVAFISAVENAKSGMAPFRWRYIAGVVPKEQALQAYLDDAAKEWERKYDGG